MQPESTRFRIGLLPCALAIAATLLTGCSRTGPEAAAPAPAATPPPEAHAPAVAPAAKPTESQLEAATILKGMADYLAGLKSFTCTTRNGYDVLQSSGRMIEFGETRRMTLARPDRLRVEEVSSDGSSDLALFDGKLMTLFNADAGVYAQVAQPGSLDDALLYFVRDLHMRMPLAIMLSTHVRTELPALIKSLDYVESTDLLGHATHHLAGSTDSVDFQLWIADGNRPLPLRVVIRYIHEPGQPQFWSEFSNWNTSPQLASSTFQLALPKDAKKIAFAIQVARPGQAQKPAAASGEVKP
jgi:hypothetical protein